MHCFSPRQLVLKKITIAKVCLHSLTRPNMCCPRGHNDTIFLCFISSLMGSGKVYRETGTRGRDMDRYM